MPPITVGIDEDSAAFRTKLRDFINTCAGLSCPCAFPTATEAIVGMPSYAPAVVLMDLQLPDLTGIECVARLKPKLPNTEFLIFTVHEDSDQIFNALKAGASGYLLKRTPPDDIVAAIRD